MPECPKCSSADVNPADEGSWASCNDCGWIQYDAWTLSIQAEARREYREAVDHYWPEKVPDYQTWMEERGKRRD